MADLAFVRMATGRAVTKRPPALAGGRRGEPALHLADIACTPLDPVTAELAARLGLETPHTLRQTFVDGTLDVAGGDVLVVGDRDYPVRAVEPYEWSPGTTYLRLVLEVLAR